MPTLDEAKACMNFVLHKLEDVWHLEVALLSGATHFSEASNLMNSVHTMLEQVLHLLVNAAPNLEFKDDSRVQSLMTSVVDVGNLTEKVIHNFLDKAGESKPSLTEMVTKISSKPVNLFLLHMLGSQMHEIKLKLENITNNAKNLYPNQNNHGDRTISGGAFQRSAQQSHVPTVQEHVCYEDLQMSITEKLLDLRIPERLEIAITGPEVTGKSILAQKIYQSVSEKDHFRVCFWLFDMTLLNFQRPELFKPIDILRKMLTTLEPQNSLDGYDEADFISRICDSLKEKRYLVVIDNISRYKVFRKALPDVNNGSRVLIATNAEDLHDFDCLFDPLNKYRLPYLTEQERQKLIFGKPIEKKESLTVNCNKEILDAARKIAYHWDKKPMMLILLGAHLRFNQRFLRISKFIKNIAAETDDQILTNIYNNLPSVLLTCLAYMAALFPVNYLIYSPSLIRLWIAEEIIPNVPDITVQETAYRCLDELIQRGFVRAIPVYYHNQDNRRCYVVVIHPWLQSQLLNNCTGENKCHPIKVVHEGSALEQPGDYGGTDYEMHRLAYHSSYESDRFFSIENGERLPGFKCRNLHSLFFFGSVALPLKFSEFCFLRVLAVFQARIRFSEDDRQPCWLDDLINLRYLGFILCWVESGSLGKKLGSLKHLQTLELSESFISGWSKFMVRNNITVIGPIKEEQRGCWSPIPEMWRKTDH